MPKLSNSFVDSQLHERKVHGTPLFSFETYRMINPSHSLFVISHWHREVEILCFQQGRASVLLSGQEFPVEGGDIVFVNQSELHQISSEDPDLFYHALDFPVEFLSFARQDYAQSHYLEPLADRKLHFPTFLSHEYTETTPVFQELLSVIEAYDEKPPGFELCIKASLLKIIGLLLRGGMMLTPDEKGIRKNSKRDRQLKDIISYIQAHYGERMYIDDIADTFHMSGKYFSRYFKQNFGRTFVEYLNHFRIEKACGMLTDTDMELMEISFAAGFDNYSYFIKKFKEITGVTPGSFRSLLSEATHPSPKSSPLALQQTAKILTKS